MLEKDIMDAVRAGRKGRFLIGASLADEKAKENKSGGYFTQALCSAFSPDKLGQDYEKEMTLSLDHLVRQVDNILLKMGSQAVSRFPTAGDKAWDNFVLFRNPYYKSSERA